MTDRKRQSITRWTVFETSAGWDAIQHCSAGVLRVLIGHRSRQSLIAALPADAVFESRPTELAQRIQDYFAGAPDDFRDVPIAAQWSTRFQYDVIAAVKQVGYGQTTTYGELAARSKHPGAARAVGQVMATNPVPLLVPCHRVLGSGGSLGGFSAPTGLSLKKRLLQIEANGLHVSGKLLSVPDTRTATATPTRSARR
jgi:methylated-DNA-[protein]-cysteine S-methyltransferase